MFAESTRKMVTQNTSWGEFSSSKVVGVTLQVKIIFTNKDFLFANNLCTGIKVRFEAICGRSLVIFPDVPYQGSCI